jgi:hypothetical protein
MGHRTKKTILARKLLSYALDELYCFADDDIESALDVAIIKFRSRPDWRTDVRAQIFSNEAMRNKIGSLAMGMFQ